MWLQVRKWDLTDHWYCTMHQRRIENLDWLPDPVLNTNGSEYLPLNEIFGKPTTDAARPSLKKKPVPTESDQKKKQVCHEGRYL